MNLTRRYFFCLVLFLVIKSLNAQIPISGIVAKYTFSGNSLDMSGNGNHLAVYGATLTTDRFGNKDEAYWFDGFDDYMICNSIKKFPVGNVAKSISIWFKFGVASAATPKVLAGFGSLIPAHARSFQIAHYDGWRINGYGDSYDWRTMIFKPGYLDTKWHHCVVTYDGYTTMFYIDCQMLASTSQYHYNTSAERIILAKEIDNDGWLFDGSLDDVTIYDKAINEEEVKAIYENTDYGIISLVEIIDGYNLRPVFLWHKVDSVTNYTLKIDNNPNFASPFTVLMMDDTTYIPLSDLPIDTIYWKVSTDKNQHSIVSKFIVKDKRIPIIIPFSEKVTLERQPVFQWHSVENANHYTLVIDTNRSFVNPIIAIPLIDTIHSPFSDLPTSKIYWKVKSNLIETYSDIDWLIIQDDSLPVLYRYNGSMVATQTPVFAWKPVNEATSYRVEIDTTKNFKSHFISVPVTDTLFIPNIMLSYNLYYWRVSSSRNLTQYSPYDSLFVVANLNATSIILLDNSDLKIDYNNFSGILSLYTDSEGTLNVLNLQGMVVQTYSFSPGLSGKPIKMRLAGSGRRSIGAGCYLINVSTTKNECITRRINIVH